MKEVGGQNIAQKCAAGWSRKRAHAQINKQRILLFNPFQRHVQFVDLQTAQVIRIQRKRSTFKPYRQRIQQVLYRHNRNSAGQENVHQPLSRPNLALSWPGPVRLARCSITDR
ncbi:hypothetical protein ALQ37_200231 [Pseudomonas syringae pv. aptata]|uniref:Uncharacterized protein n=1 Tax=Pseudomonas syringae pv. aptata TaxID=83167 RepID=A0A3M3X673_PSEAP|nr:hypothetical protein ALQ37_200231 [Pseudomonas syringae pv. aptata]